MVWSANVETGEVELKEVTEVFVKEDNVLVHLTINGNVINTTALHPFYVVDKGWTEAIEINVGDKVLLQNGTTAIVEDKTVEKLETPIKVYNFTVADFHTYFVGEKRILVHNSQCGVKISNDNISENPLGKEIVNGLKKAEVQKKKNPITNVAEPYLKQFQIDDTYKVILRRDIGDYSHGDANHWNLEIQTLGGKQKYDLHLYVDKFMNIINIEEYKPKR